MAIRCVLFDIGGVLLTLGEEAYRREVAAQLGLPAIPALYDDMLPAIQRGEIDEREVWATIAGRAVDIASFDPAWLRYYQPVPAMLNLAAQVRQRGVRVALLSNTEASHLRVMQTMGFLGGFGHAFMSCELGSRKPELAVYKLALEHLGLAPDEVAYVDDVAEYVAAAGRLGIHAILHADVEQTRRSLMGLLDQVEWDGEC